MEPTTVAAIVAAITLLLIFVFAIYLLRSTVNLVQQGSVGVVKRLGEFHGIHEPGMVVIAPFIDAIVSRCSRRPEGAARNRRSPARPRNELLEAAAKEAGGHARDRVRRHRRASCRRDRRSGRRLGGIDALVYAPGIGPLARLADTDAATWRRVFDTNVTGAALVTERRDRRPHRVGRHRGLPVVGQRVAHPAVARARRVRREQGRARQARRGVAGRAPARRLHARRRRRLRGRRRRRADRSSPNGWDMRARGGALSRSGRRATTSAVRSSTSTTSSRSSTACCAAARRSRSRRSRSRRARHAPA